MRQGAQRGGQYAGRSVYAWRDTSKRQTILHQGWSPATDLLIFDEIHKMPAWKAFLKGIFDTVATGTAILVTGSARLDTFRQGGDSLAGRFFHHRLFPITPAEAGWAQMPLPLDHFLEHGGFPEPFLAAEPADSQRWRRFYLDGLIREDILTFDNIRDLRAMQLLVELLRTRVGSPLSYQSLAEDLSVAPNTVRKYLDVLDALYITFRIFPHQRSIARSLSQQPKVYFFDTGLVSGDPGARLENHVALALAAALANAEDRDGARRSLRYLRTKEHREVDFVLTAEDQPLLMAEVKRTDRSLSPALVYFHERYQIPAVQLVGEIRQELYGEIPIVDVQRWLEQVDYCPSLRQ